MTYYPITVVCCDCGKFLGTKDGGTTPNQISHGYCEECKKKTMKEIESYKSRRN